LGWVWVALVLYGVILHWNLGSVVFLTMTMITGWIVVVLIGIGMGLVHWPKARQRAANFVCTEDFHRFVPGPALGWTQRWTARWLWRENGAPKDLADSCVCRACGKAGRFENVQVLVAVLDKRGISDPQHQGSTLRVNWLEKKQPFDFDRVEVVEATDADVEEFVRQTRYDSDPQLQKRLPRMQCVVNAQCHFQRENTMTILRQTFGSVTKD
jgi:hypothetical protein